MGERGGAVHFIRGRGKHITRIRSSISAVRCIGVACSFGAPFAGCEVAPDLVRRAGLVALLQAEGMEVNWPVILYPEEHRERQDAFRHLLHSLADEAEDAVEAGERVLIVGGDHSIAAATWRGVGRALGQAPGLLWIDAHLDAHTAATSISGNVHGMPLAALFGMGNALLTGIPGPPLDPARTVVIGARSYEAAEVEHLEALRVRVITMAEVRERGISEVFDEALGIVSDGPWGLTLDLDVLDPVVAPGVSTPAAEGMSAQAVGVLLKGVLREHNCVGLEIAEYNPSRDIDGLTLRLLLSLLEGAGQAR